jgi:hypothetical protein
MASLACVPGTLGNDSATPAHCVLVWSELNATRLRAALSRDAGRTWLPAQDLNVTGLVASEWAPSAACSAQACVLTVAVSRPRSIVVFRSTSLGQSWARGTTISGSALEPDMPSISCSADGTCACAFRTRTSATVRQAVATRSLDHGATWTAPVKVAQSIWGERDVQTPTVACISGTQSCVMTITMLNTPNSGLFPWVAFSRSADAGASWEQAQELSYADFSSREQTATRCFGGVCVAAWKVTADQDPSPMLAVSENGGVTWLILRVPSSKNVTHAAVAIACVPSTATCVVVCEQGAPASTVAQIIDTQKQQAPPTVPPTVSGAPTTTTTTPQGQQSPPLKQQSSFLTPVAVACAAAAMLAAAGLYIRRWTSTRKWGLQASAITDKASTLAFWASPSNKSSTASIFVETDRPSFIITPVGRPMDALKLAKMRDVTHSVQSRGSL